MAKRKVDVRVEMGIASTWLGLWCDDDFVRRVQAIKGVRKVSGADRYDGAHTVWIDGRYDASDVMVEIESLAAEQPVQSSPSLGDRVTELGRECGEAGSLILAVSFLLAGVKNYSSSSDGLKFALDAVVEVASKEARAIAP
jgi:hypothetical protein